MSGALLLVAALGATAADRALTPGSVTEPYGEEMPLPNPLGSGPPPHSVGSAASLGGHSLAESTLAAPEPGAESESIRRAILEEMWQRGILSPEQQAWAPADRELLLRIRRAEPEALAYLKSRFGGYRPWISARRVNGLLRSRLSKAGYAKYLLHLTQDAVAYFESKGANVTWVFKLRDREDRPLFTPEGQITEEGMVVYGRAKLRLEVYWKGPGGEFYGTRRPPSQAAPPPETELPGEKP